MATRKMEPKGRRRTKVALFGGSFNPPHWGHLDIVRYLLAQGGFDEVWVIPCLRHPLKKRLAPFWERFKMTRLAVRPLGSSVRVLDVERRLGGVSWTWRTIRYLKKVHPDHDFSWVIGRDQEKGKWQKWDEIEKGVALFEIPRGPASPIRDISSTEVRERVETGKSLEGLIPSVVLSYLRRKGAYHRHD